MTVWQLVEWIEHHLHQEITRTVLEKKAGYSSRHLYKLFIADIGISVTAYIRKRRLTLASVMLRETNRSVTEIALMYQFNYLQTFSRAFRKQFRLSPLQYRHARYWDMKDYYPSAIVKKFSCKTHVACVNKDAFISPKNKFSYKINFGYTFIINIKDKKINSYPQIYQDCINFIFQKKTNQPLVVFGELKPGIKSDTVIDIFSGYFTTQKRPGVINIPDGYYFCFTSIGTPLELMKFINWAKGHGMHCFGQVLKKGPTFTVFTETNTKDVYKAEHYMPCINPRSVAMHA
ncbi:helix-turn-helix domain-containing protein [Salmonella enterica]|uniref:Helix-turn-helix domain-containing protein n=3 Tax=Salmonella enterica TaxID=28901 RepID=A0A8F7UJ00_SALER|nr:helix-turn-helix domain-containing protein [Salmonella enterica]EDI0279144.1 hypothetical protein [Salmonella enterica subsp. enterica serovar Tennessee]EDK1862962.1 hypothetical protein [Salmonella enterica subsp. enterica serovar Montevideo]EDL5691536.1 hypothetical protein [Salmonella enterica subsp. enterica serovar Carmel]EDL5696396.1 hypothetical protein [Salmonella enterica subsp. enterica serovar Newport]EEP8043169.1 helix-turn-helix domain-containing protein [Salmonella enterica su